MLTPVSGTGQAPPDAIVAVLVPFAKLFTNPTWRKAQVLVVGAILTPGQRTVTAALRVMGRSDHGDYARYHEVLNRAVWSPRQAGRILLMLLLQHLDHGDDPLVLGPNPPKGWRYSSGMGDEWQRGAMVRTGLRVDGSGGGLSAVAWRPCAVCRRWQGEMAGRGRSKGHSRTGVARVCGAVG